MASNNKPRNSFYDPFRTNPITNRTAVAERMYMRLLTEWAATRFKWVGLPDTIDPRFIEQELFYKAMVLFYYDPRFDRYLAARGAVRGPMNLYDNPTNFRTVGIATYPSIELSGDECVPIWASYSRLPSRDIVLLYAARLAALDVSLEINAKNLRANKIIKVEEGQRQTAVNMLRQIDEGNVIFGTNALDMGTFEVLDFGSPAGNLDALRMEKNQVWNEAMTLLGITNSNQDKKERLVAAEATGSDGQVLAARNSEMKPRMEACDQINLIYPDLNVSVEWDLDPDIMPTVGESPDDAREVEDATRNDVGDEA